MESGVGVVSLAGTRQQKIAATGNCDGRGGTSTGEKKFESNIIWYILFFL